MPLVNTDPQFIIAIVVVILAYLWIGPVLNLGFHDITGKVKVDFLRMNCLTILTQNAPAKEGKENVRNNVTLGSIRND